MDKKTLIFGKGFIGERLQAVLGCAVSRWRITSFKDVEKEIAEFKPKTIINCIGYTGERNVDGCEAEKDATLSANLYVPLLLAEAAIRNKIKFVHISSGCIYHYDYLRDKPIREERVPDFFGLYYSRSKIYAERSLEVLSRRYGVLITRIRIPLDNRPHPRNILTKLLDYPRVIDIPNSVTYIPDFIAALKHLLKADACGIYNVVNKGGLRYPRLLEVYRKYASGPDYKVIGQKKLGLLRTNLLLSTRKLEKTGFKVRNINEVLEECVRAYVKS